MSLASKPAARSLLVVLTGAAVFAGGLVWSALAPTTGSGVHFGAAALIAVGELGMLIGIGAGVGAFLRARRRRGEPDDAS